MVSFAFLTLVAVQALNNIASARRSFRVPAPPFPNITNFANITDFANVTHLFDAGVQCIPFEDPHCCVELPVCECRNGITSMFSKSS
ncbi:hypothetical protein F4781DRAFT_394249 [Annulohypoxylon bovei var. microspora]|nr:hypothetical protein F4781DRAFT_394249 [Annulohypoxylon bovei var. microspora]